VSAATRELVLSTAARLGHVPNAPARALRSGKSHIALALVPGFTLGAITDSVLEGLDLALTERGMALLVHRHSHDERPLEQLWGLVYPELVVSLGGLSNPEINTIQHATAKLFSIRGIVPHSLIGEMQAEHLSERGYRSIAFAYPDDPALSSIANERLEGVRAACRRLGIDEPTVVDVRLDGSNAREAVRSLVTEGFTGVCCHNDALALNLLSAARAEAIAVPGRLALIGVDDAVLARWTLSTIRIDVDRFRAAVVDSVIALLDDRKPPVIDSRAMAQLVVRETT
jgi:DNA-binding LacI/PurR family transcriptional regulator